MTATAVTAPPAIEARGLTKRFGDTTALAGVDLDVPPGTVLGLLGPNGAGKTTLVRVLTTLLDPDGGSARVAGIDVRGEPRDLRAVIGLAGQFAAVDERLTGRENLDLVGRLYGLGAEDRRARTADILERFGLDTVADRLAGTYSGGMRRRLDLAATLIGRPAVLFLDEPTAGLDPRSRAEVWALVGDLVAAGTTVLLTSQYLEEIDRLADQVVVLDHGAVIATGTTAELKARVGGEQPTLDDVFLALTGHPAEPDDDASEDDGEAVPAPLPAARTALPHPAPPDQAAAAARGGLRRYLGDLAATTRREWLQARRSPQLMVFTLLQPVLFVVLTAAVFGGAIARGTSDDPHAAYLDFLLPGSLVMAVVLAGTGTSVGVARDRQQGFTDRLRALPAARSAPLAGRSVAELGRRALSVVVMVAAAWLMGFRAPAGWSAVLAGMGVTLAFGFATVWLFALVGLAVRDEETANVASFLPALLLVFASSTFVPVDTMPGWLQAVARYQPVTIAVDTVRAVMAGQVPADGWWPVAAWTTALLVVFVPLSVRRYGRPAPVA